MYLNTQGQPLGEQKQKDTHPLRSLTRTTQHPGVSRGHHLLTPAPAAARPPPPARKGKHSSDCCEPQVVSVRSHTPCPLVSYHFSRDGDIHRALPLLNDQGLQLLRVGIHLTTNAGHQELHHWVELAIPDAHTHIPSAMIPGSNTTQHNTTQQLILGNAVLGSDVNMQRVESELSRRQVVHRYLQPVCTENSSP